MTEQDKDSVIHSLQERINLMNRTNGQNTARTLIDCMNHFLQMCPNSCKVTASMENHRHNLVVSRNGAHVFSIEGARNLQVCYEELLNFIIESYFHSPDDGMPPASTQIIN